MNDLNNTTSRNESCKDCRDRLSDLLLDPGTVPAAIAAHAASCAACGEELAALRATFAALDAWTAPEPSAYFDTRLHARLRELQAAPPEGFFERMRSFFTFSTGRHLRPALAGALGLVLVVSGGSFVGIHGIHSGHSAQTSATVNDLKVIDVNAQALQQMGQLLDENDDSDTPPSS